MATDTPVPLGVDLILGGNRAPDVVARDLAIVGG